MLETKGSSVALPSLSFHQKKMLIKFWGKNWSMPGLS